ncbi:MAG: hypothetical protein HY428_02560, partial [Candidatus Levybacteria bacterium]|nr:hypothetical protein [Candidatus Levybacteria bacterium]
MRKMFSPYLSKINKQDKKERLIFNLSILGILLFLALAVTLPFRDQLLNFLFPKPPAQAVETWVEVGTHPEASIETTTAAKELRTLAVWNGKIYAGYGDYGVNTGPMFVSPFDPVTKTFTQVHKACTEAAYLIRVIGDRLYIPATDRHSATCGFPGADYTVGKEDGTWEDRFVVTSEHMFEMLTFSGTDIWMVGANGNNAAAWRSLDNGATWQRMLLVPPVSGISGDFARFYFAGVLNGKLYMQAKDFNGPAHPTSKVFDGTNWSDGPSLLPAWAYGGNTTPFLGKLFYRGYHDFASSLFQFDGITYSPVPHPENGGDFIVYQMDIYNNEFYVLSNQPNSTFLAIYKTTNLANWTKVASTVPINARSFALLNGKYYIGTSDSKIYEYDPSPLPPTQANPLITPDYFPFGVFEDGNLLGTPQNFTATLTDLKAHNLDSIMLVNTRAAWANEYLPLSDTQNVNVLWYLSELNNSWWPDTVPDTIEKAREVVQPLVDQVNGSTHPS